MNRRRTTPLPLLLLALAVGACRTAAPVDVVGSGAGGDGGWLCEPAADRGWACTQAAAPGDREAVAPVAPDAATAPPAPSATKAGPPPAPSVVQRTAGAEAEQTKPASPAAAAPAMPDRLAGVPATHYAVQLIALKSAAALRAFMAEAQLADMTVVRVENGGVLHHALLAGVYASRTEADRAVAALAPALQALEPWARTVASLRAAMARADALADSR